MKSFKWSMLSVDEKIEVLKRPVINNQEMLVEKTKKIIELVRTKKDKALIDLTKQYDNVLLDSIKVKEEDIQEAVKNISPSVKKAIKQAVENISLFHRAIKPRDKKVQIGPGIICEQVRRAIPAVGLYVPGGTAPLVSTVLMLGIPSKIAECATRIICTPPSADGTVNPNILYAASLCGITQIYKVGGAQAIAAMAYGTESIPKVVG